MSKTLEELKDTITDQDIEQIEDLVGMGCGAWDCICPKELASACFLVLNEKEKNEKD